ncbi:hypothetical protein SELMODRAFT_428609 [Selaginella moellendorffii]|uniref:Uncharacterized protein n=1 Tax=Selaginella moellendorffii TaxID=88036 RepID=D8T3E7_SELML|nr:hypothetical protein SELMODRAFT_428609 [Selaginella moellendorffii]
MAETRFTDLWAGQAQSRRPRSSQVLWKSPQGNSGKCGRLALGVFHKMEGHAAFAQNGQEELVNLFKRMLEDPSGPEPDRLTFFSVVGACNSLERSILSQWRGRSLEMLQTALLNMYARCHSLDDARKVFTRFAAIASTMQGKISTRTRCAGTLARRCLRSDWIRQGSAANLPRDGSSSRVSLMLALEACSNDGGDVIKQGRALHERIGRQRRVGQQHSSKRDRFTKLLVKLKSIEVNDGHGE